MTRIRYTKNNDVYVTSWLSVAPNVVLRGVIHYDSFFSIENLSGEVVQLGTADNTRKAKYLIRKILVSYGLKLDGEIRNRA